MKSLAAVGYVGTAEEGPVRALMHMAGSYMEQERLAEAEEAVAEALKSAREESKVDLLCLLGDLRRRQGDPAGARRRVEEALAGRPDSPGALAGLAELALAAGDVKGAVAGWEKVAALRPRYPHAKIQLAKALRERAESEGARPDDLGRAITLIRDAVRPEPEAEPDLERLSAQGHNILGMALLRAGNFPEAVAQFRRAAEKDPRYLKPRTNMGVVHLNLASRCAAELGTATDGERRKALEEGLARYRAEALRWFGEVLAIDAANPKALYNRAEAFFFLPPRDLPAAERDLLGALAKDPGYRKARALLDRVREARAGADGGTAPPPAGGR